MLNPKSLKRILEHQERMDLIDEGFIEEDLPNPEKIVLKRVYESNGNYQNIVIINSEKNYKNRL